MSTTSVDRLVANLGKGDAAKTKASRKPILKKVGTSALIGINNAPIPEPVLPTEGTIKIDPASVYVDTAINQRIHTGNIRKRDEAYKSLRKSLREEGQLQPIMVRPTDRPGFSYELVFGSTRLSACEEEGLQVDAIVRPMSDEEALARAYTENEERTAYWPIEEARALMCFLETGQGKTPKYRIKKYEDSDRTTKHRLKDFSLLPDLFIECCSVPEKLTERNTRTFRSYYKKNKGSVDQHIIKILQGPKRYTPAALTSLLKDDTPVKRKQAVQYKDADNNVVLSIHGSKNNDGRQSQSVTLYNSDVDTLDELITALTALKNRLEPNAVH